MTERNGTYRGVDYCVYIGVEHPLGEEKSAVVDGLEISATKEKQMIQRRKLHDEVILIKIDPTADCTIDRLVNDETIINREIHATCIRCMRDIIVSKQVTTE